LGLIRRLRTLFKANSETEENPELILNAYIEASSESLRELAVTVKRAQSEALNVQEKMTLVHAEMEAKRGKADAAAKESNPDAARKWLEQIHAQRLLYEQLQQESEQKARFADELSEKLKVLSEKVQTAKRLVEQYRLRYRHAGAVIAAGKALVPDRDSSAAFDQIQEDLFLAEAKAELARTRPYT